MAQIEQFPSYFTAIGGLNTESSPVNPQPNEAVDLTNIVINKDGSFQRRKAIDLLSSTYFTHTEDILYNGRYNTPCIRTKIFTVSDSNNVLRTYNITHIGTELHITELPNIGAIVDGATQIIDIDDDCDPKCALFPTTFLVDRNKVICINKYMNLIFIEYDARINSFTKYSSDILVRDIRNTPHLDSYVTRNGLVYKCVRTHKTISSSTDVNTGVFLTGLPEKISSITNLSVQVRYDPGGLVNPDADVRLLRNGSVIKSVGVDDGDTITFTYTDLETGSYVLDIKQPSVTYALYAFTVTTEAEPYILSSDYSVMVTNGYEQPSEVCAPGTGTCWQSFWEVYGDSQNTYSAWADDTEYTSNIKSIFCYWTDTPTNSTTNYTDYFYLYKDWSDGLTRFDGGCLAGGRLWLFNSIKPNEVVFSYTIKNNINDYIKAYQFADPYNKYDSALVDTDGGTIVITGAEKIYGIIPFGTTVLVLANNGIWQIKSPDNFIATNFTIDKLSDEGIVALNAVTNIEDAVVYLSNGSVNAVTNTDFGTAKVSTISAKIDSLYKNIHTVNKEGASVYYDYSNKLLYIAVNIDFNDWNVTLRKFNQPTQYRNLLVFDAFLKCWYKFDLTADTSGTKLAIGSLFFSEKATVGTQTVTDNSGAVVIDALSVTVTSKYEPSLGAQTVPVFTLFKRSGDTIAYQYGALDLTSVGTDFASDTTEDYEYDSYWVGTQNLYTDLMHMKQPSYIVPVFKRIESGTLDVNGVDVTPGGCLMNIAFNWAMNIKAAKYSDFYSVYHPYKFNLAYHDGSQNGYDIVTSKIRLRGRGQVFRLMFKNDSTKDFHLYGWQINLHMNRKD